MLDRQTEREKDREVMSCCVAVAHSFSMWHDATQQNSHYNQVSGGKLDRIIINDTVYTASKQNKTRLQSIISRVLYTGEG